jgi:hypothetical protein
MGLRVEENFDVSHILEVYLAEVGHGEIVKITLFNQDTCAFVINVEKLLKVAEAVSLAEVFYSVVFQFYAIPLCYFEHELGLKGAFNVQVELGFWQSGDKRVERILQGSKGF